MNDFQKSTKMMVGGVFKKYPPDWFITVMWNDFPRDPVTCVSHSRHFKNVVLSNLYDVNRVEHIPSFPRRLGLMFFHERKEHDVGDKWITVFHTHIHLYNDTKRLTSTVGGHSKFPRQQLTKHVHRLFKGEKNGFRGLDVRKWNRERHHRYNYKDLYNHQYKQDGDVVLDYENSDIPRYRRSLNVKQQSLHYKNGWCPQDYQSLLR